MEIKNPASNTLPDGISEDDVSSAIKKSGYPLQSKIANQLEGKFSVQEEWDYIDGNANTNRTIDILARQRLYYFKIGHELRVRPELSIAIECKQSDLPYVFFKTAAPSYVRDFPLIAGLSQDTIVLRTNGDLSTFTLPIIDALSLRNHSFLRADVSHSATFSKCVRQGKNIVLCGSDSFNSLMFPLVKAIQHFRREATPPTTARYFDCYIVLAVAVLDAPIIVSWTEQEEQKQEMRSWVRVLKNVARDNADHTRRSDVYAVDVVHKDFFDSYINDHVLPFSQEFSKRVQRHGRELATSKGFIKNLNGLAIKDYEANLEPR